MKYLAEEMKSTKTPVMHMLYYSHRLTENLKQAADNGHNDKRYNVVNQV
jgi:hypothetical protein